MVHIQTFFSKNTHFRFYRAIHYKQMDEISKEKKVTKNVRGEENYKAISAVLGKVLKFVPRVEYLGDNGYLGSTFPNKLMKFHY